MTRQALAAFLLLASLVSYMPLARDSDLQVWKPRPGRYALKLVHCRTDYDLPDRSNGAARMQHAGFLSRWTTTGPKRATATHAAAGSACTINIYYIDGRDGRGVSAHIIRKGSNQASTPTSDDSDRKKPPR